MKSGNPLLEIKGLSVEVGGCSILDNVDLTFERGKIYALKGDLDEHEEFKWIRADEIDKYDRIKDTHDIIKMALRNMM